MSDCSASLEPGDLACVEMFTGMDAAGLADALDRGRVRRFDRDTIIFSQGTPAKRAHAVLSGRIRITQSDPEGSQLLVRFVGPGESYGTMGLFTDHTYPGNAVAVVESVEISWPEKDLLELIDRHPRIAINLVRTMGARLREIQDRLREVATQRVERRIANALLRLGERAGKPTEQGTAINFPLSRKDIAEMCGATIHTVSRTLTAWEKAAILSTDQQYVTIRDLAQIRLRADL